MNVKAMYANHIDSWDTMANGLLALSCAHLEVWYDEAENETALFVRTDKYSSGEAVLGEANILLTVKGRVKTLPELCEAAYEDLGLLRLDVDGETIYEAPAESGY